MTLSTTFSGRHDLRAGSQMVDLRSDLRGVKPAAAAAFDPCDRLAHAAFFELTP
jgi:hypothetical protein